MAETQPRKKMTARQWLRILAGVIILLLLVAVLVLRGDILRGMLDPGVPFQTYDPPAAPDYRDDSAWALKDAMTDRTGEASVFFLHSTTFNGGKDWNGPIGDPEADAYLHRVVLPNFAGPFAMAGKVSAPLYRQGSLYTRLSMREDAREARSFAYRDVDAAFSQWLNDHPDGPIVLAGAEQGGDLLARLLRDRVLKDDALKSRLVAAYLMDSIVPEGALDMPVCKSRNQAGCLVAWSMVAEGEEAVVNRRMRRALFWDDKGRLMETGYVPIVCVNPVSGSDEATSTAPRRHLGAANATGLEWGLRPAFIDRAVGAECREGFLRNTRLKTESFRENRGWADRRKATPYNLFYADTEADVLARLAMWKSNQTTEIQQ